jgi:hypothetical protein
LDRDAHVILPCFGEGVDHMGTLTPRDMEAVVLAFGDALAELGVAR